MKHHVYHYRCELGHLTEAIQDAPTGVVRCATCGRDAVRQVTVQEKATENGRRAS